MSGFISGSIDCPLVPQKYATHGKTMSVWALLRGIGPSFHFVYAFGVRQSKPCRYMGPEGWRLVLIVHILVFVVCPLRVSTWREFDRQQDP